MHHSSSAASAFTVRALACGLVLAAASLIGVPTAAGAPAPCANADLDPTAATVDTVRAAVLCLTNAERDALDLPALRESRKLRNAAIAHSADMIRAGYFAHTEPDGETFVDRILKTRYVRRFDGYLLGENLAWGTGELATAGAVHEAWMNSAGHKANLLKASYRDIGIGIGTGIPSDASVGATYTIDFGVRR